MRGKPVAETCSCGCPNLHEVARRTTFDGGLLVVLSSGEVRLHHHLFTATLSLQFPPQHPPLMELLGWAGVLDAANVKADLLRMRCE